MPQHIAAMKLTIQTLEGSGDCSVLGCYVTVDGHLYDIITPLGPETQSDSVDIPRDGLLRLAVRFMGREDRLLGGVAVPISLLREGKEAWLPLRTRYESEILTSVPGECKAPRIQVKLGSEAKQELRTRGGSMPQLPLFDQEKASPGPHQSAYIQERQKMRIQKQTTVIEDLNQQLSDLRLYLSKQTQQETQWRKLYSDTVASAEAAAARFRSREEILSKEMREMEGKVKGLMEENMKLRQELMGKQSEGYQLVEENSVLKAQIVLLDRCQDATPFARENSVLRARIMELEHQIVALQGDVKGNSHVRPSFQAVPDSFLDLALSEFFLHRELPISKVSTGVYSHAQERFLLSFRSGMLVVKTKTGYLLLSEYLRLKNVQIPRDEDIIVEFPASRALPTVRTVPSPIQHREAGVKTEQTAESDADSTFQTDISNLIKELEFDPANPSRKKFPVSRLKETKMTALETSKGSKKPGNASPRQSIRSESGRKGSVK